MATIVAKYCGTDRASVSPCGTPYLTLPVSPSTSVGFASLNSYPCVEWEHERRALNVSVIVSIKRVNSSASSHAISRRYARPTRLKIAYQALLFQLLNVFGCRLAVKRHPLCFRYQLLDGVTGLYLHAPFFPSPIVCFNASHTPPHLPILRIPCSLSILR
jgi:hypothetical protein